MRYDDPTVADLGRRRRSVTGRPSASPPADKARAMPVIPFSSDLVFDPEHLRAMLAAFDIVCTELKLVRGKGDQRTELVALKIIDLAQAGERSADELAARVLDEFAPNEVSS